MSFSAATYYRVTQSVASKLLGKGMPVKHPKAKKLQGTKALLHLVVFFFYKLSPAERNYDVGDCELLAIKAALEEWRYPLEGTAHPILIFTDHKNLEFLRTAKNLRPHQAKWALFFSRFAFHKTYRLGSKNAKPDALSCMFGEPEKSGLHDTILSSGNVLLLQEDLISRIKQASVGNSLTSQDVLTNKRWNIMAPR